MSTNDPNYNKSNIFQGTFTISDDEDGSKSSPSRKPLRSRTATIRGKDHDLPPEVRSYVASHLRMVRDENESLRRSLDERNRQLDRLAREHEECR